MKAGGVMEVGGVSGRGLPPDDYSDKGIKDCLQAYNTALADTSTLVDAYNTDPHTAKEALDRAKGKLADAMEKIETEVSNNPKLFPKYFSNMVDKLKGITTELANPGVDPHIDQEKILIGRAQGLVEDLLTHLPQK